MSIDAMTALGMTSNETLEKKLKVWCCDEYTWVLAANRGDADKVYTEYMQDCHGESIVAVEVASPDDFTVLSLDELKFYRYFDDGNPGKRFLQEYDEQLAKDGTTPRIFAVGE